MLLITEPITANLILGDETIEEREEREKEFNKLKLLEKEVDTNKTDQ